MSTSHDFNTYPLVHKPLQTKTTSVLRWSHINITWLLKKQ